MRNEGRSTKRRFVPGIRHVGRKMAAFGPFIVLVLMTSVAWSADLRLQDHPAGIWALPDTPKERRWIVIHNPEQGEASGVYHIEVLSRATGAPAWTITHRANHMAITREALLRSVIAPLTKGAVYPESFDYAYREWQTRNGGTGGEVCESDVLHCLTP